MGTGYTRNDVANNIADGNDIDAADLDGEFDAIEAAFVAATGHTHDGTAAEGGAVEVIGPVQDGVMSASAFAPKSDNAYDLGTASLEWKDLFIDGVANIDSLIADTADINGGTIDGAIIGASSAAAITATDLTASGTIDFSGATVSDLGAITTADINGGTIDGTVIGGSSAAAVSATTITGSGTATFNGDVLLGSDASDTITFNGDTDGNITPNTDDADDIGSSSQRYQDIYLSGGIFLGGTAAANQLTNVQKGTWTPNLTFGGSQVGMTFTLREGRYTVIEDVVKFSATIIVNNNGSSTGLARVSLPLTSSNDEVGLSWIVNVTMSDSGGGGPTLASDEVALIGVINQNSSSVEIKSQDTNDVSNINETDIPGGTTIVITGEYHLPG